MLQCTPADHGVTLCYRTRAAEIEELHNVNALKRSWICIQHYVTALRDFSSSVNTMLECYEAAVLDPIIVL